MVKHRTALSLCCAAVLTSGTAAAAPTLADIGAWSSALGFTPSLDPKTDADADGVSDVYDICPGFSEAASPYYPECYIGGGTPLGAMTPLMWLPVEYRPAPGSDWANANCTPAMAFRVKDDVAGVKTSGAVIVGVKTPIAGVGVSQKFQPFVDAAIDNWPAAESGYCLLSVDLANQKAIFVDNPMVANAWVQFTKTDDLNGKLSPKRGIGLATGGQANFQTRDIYTKTAGRQRFTRAAIYGEQDLGATTTIKPVACGTPGAVPVWGSANGGVKLAVCYQFGTVPPGPVWPLPPKWSIVPPNLDDAIIKDGTARADGGPPMLGSYPKGWLQDVRYRHPAAFKGIVPRSGFAAWFPLLDTTVSGPFKPVKIWLPLPPELGLHHPDFLYQKHTPTTFPVYAHDGTNTQTSQRTSRVTTDPQFGAVTVFDTLQAVHPKTGLFPETSQAASKSMLDPNGHRWNTNVGTTAKCWNGIFESQAHYPGTAPGGLSADWCPGALEGWAATSKAMEYNGNFLICNPAYESSQDKVGQILATFLNPKSVLELGVCAGIEKVKDAVLGGICCTCEGATFGTVQCCEKSCGEYVADVLGQAELACLIKQFMAQLTDYFPNSDHWPQVGGKVPFVGVVRNQSTSAIGPRATSFMTWGDFVLADAHQGNDWNWEFETHEVIDPGYRRFASVSVNGLLQPRKIEHEMEFQIAMGDWDSSASLPNPHYDWTVAQYFFGPSPKQVNLDLEWLGQLFPADQCDKHGILRDDTPKYSFVEKETWPGRTTPYNGHNIKCRTTWPEHFGRGNFTPFLEPALKVGMDYPINKLVPIAPSVLPTGVPFRRGFLGDVILDCGHPRGSGDFPAEIHPPHVLWTQFPAQTTYTIGGGYTYAEYSVFGWASENGFKEHSFDLWPPQPPGSTDPLLSAQLVVEGLEPGSFAYSTVPVEKLGVRIDNRQMTPAPTMKCSLEPKVFPNHVHCIYTAPNAGQTLGEDVERFLPKKATSRFEMRVRLGWKFKNGFVQ